MKLRSFDKRSTVDLRVSALKGWSVYFVSRNYITIVRDVPVGGFLDWRFVDGNPRNKWKKVQTSNEAVQLLYVGGVSPLTNSTAT